MQQLQHMSVRPSVWMTGLMCESTQWRRSLVLCVSLLVHVLGKVRKVEFEPKPFLPNYLRQEECNALRVQFSALIGVP